MHQNAWLFSLLCNCTQCQRKQNVENDKKINVQFSNSFTTEMNVCKSADLT